MSLFPAPALLSSLKFRIVALVAATSVLCALGAGVAVQRVTAAELQRQLLGAEKDASERTAAQFGHKLDMLKRSLVLVAGHAQDGSWADSEAMYSLLLNMPSLSALFDSIFAARADGAMLARVNRGERADALVHVGDRAYFQQAMATDQPVVSDPLLGKTNGEPMVIVASQAPTLDGHPRGMLGAALRLRSGNLFGGAPPNPFSATRELVLDRKGTLLWHTDTSRVMGHADDEPGLREVFRAWRDAGSPIDDLAAVTLTAPGEAGSERAKDPGHLVSLTGLPMSDWVLVRLTPRSVALAPLAAADRTAWLAALVAGCVSALLAGALAWATVRPIETMRRRAARMLEGDEVGAEHWPAERGEIGAMSQAFQLLLSARERQRAEAQSLLLRLRAVLDNADIGLVLTRNGHFEMVSRQFCQTFGCTMQAMVGRSTKSIHPSAAAYEAFSQRAHPSFMRSGQFDGEAQLRRHNGELFWARMRGRAVKPGDRTQGTIWVIADITHEHQQHEALSWAASHDRLTGLLNRAAFDLQLETAVGQAIERPSCLLFIDLDRFKQVNDTGGHAAGDRLLCDLASRFATGLRQSDTVARLGGDEFGVLLAGCPLPRARELAERLRTAVEGYTLEWEGQRHQVGASIGLVLLDGRHTSAADALRSADAACYESKRAGRNRVSESRTPRDPEGVSSALCEVAA